jgi:hypothetical protein
MHLYLTLPDSPAVRKTIKIEEMSPYLHQRVMDGTLFDPHSRLGDIELLNPYQCTFVLEDRALKRYTDWAPAVWPAIDDSNFNTDLNVCIAIDKVGHAYATLSLPLLSWLSVKPEKTDLVRVPAWHVLFEPYNTTASYYAVFLAMEEHLRTLYRWIDGPIGAQLRAETFSNREVCCIYDEDEGQQVMVVGTLNQAEFREGECELHFVREER